MKRSPWCWLALLALLTMWPGSLRAQSLLEEAAVDWAPRMSSFVTVWDDDINNCDPVVAYNSKRDQYLVVWWSAHTLTREVAAARFNSRGALLSSFIVVQDAAKMNWLPAVAYSPVQDEYLVAYTYAHSTTDFDIYARRIKWDGSWIGPPIPINTDLGKQWYPAVAYNSHDDEYLVVYENYWADGSRDIAAQRIRASDGAPLSWRNIAAAPGTVRRLPAVAYNAARNNYLIAYTFQHPGDGDIYARITSANMGVLGPELHLVDNTFHQDGVALAAGPDEVLAVWEDGPSPTHRTIYGRRITGAGDLQPYIPIGDEVNQVFTEVAVAHSELYGYLVTWRHALAPDDWDIHGRFVRAGNNAAWQQRFWIDATPRHQKSPDVACDSGGECLVVYEDDWQNGVEYDIGGRIVQGHRFYVPLTLRH
jgi:hypothetical protein